MKANSKLLWAILLSAMVFVNSCAVDTEEQKQTQTESQPAQDGVQPEPAQQIQQSERAPSLSVSQQNLNGSQIVIGSIYLDKPGFLVVHKNVENNPGMVIGHSEVLSGEKSKFLITIDANEAGTSVFAMLHYDDNNNGIYEFPAENKPIVVEGIVLTKQIAIIQPPPQQEAAPQPAPVEPKKIDEYPDPFDGTSINTEKYSTKIVGNGSIKQENEIVMTGGAKNEIIWTILHTNRAIDFTKDFTIEVDLNMTADVERGDAMAIIGVEKRDKVKGEMPKYDFCEVSMGTSHGTGIIRSQTTGHGSQISKTAGKLKLSFNALKEDFRCSLDNKEIDEDQKKQAGDFVLTLRAGLHVISGEERPGTGRFTVRYDNLNVVQGSDKR